MVEVKIPYFDGTLQQKWAPFGHRKDITPINQVKNRK
jgi:hypothetical protein